MEGNSNRKLKINRREFLAGLGLTVVSAGVAAASGRTDIGMRKAATPSTFGMPLIAPQGTEIIMGTGTDVTTIDARITMSDSAKSQITHVLEQLFWPDDEGQAIPILVSAWEPVNDPTGWRFHLRPNITFHNGEPWNADAFKYTIDSILSDDNVEWVHSDPRTRLRMVQEVKIEDPLTVVVLTDGFSRVLPLSLYRVPMLPPIYAAETGRLFGMNPVGTGHYTFKEYRTQSHLTLEAYKDYHGYWDGPAKNSGITFRFLPENATRVAALEAGEVHIVDNLPPDVVERIRSNPDLDVLSVPTSRLMGMNFHNNREPFNNLDARLAVAYAIDRDSIVKDIMKGLTTVGQTPMAEGTLGIAGEEFKPYDYDPKKAREHFTAAGLRNGQPIKIGGPVGRYINDKQIVEAVAAMVAEIGFAPELEQSEMSVYWPKVTEGAYDMFFAGYGTPAYDPDDLKAEYSGQADGGGYVHYVEHQSELLDLYEKMDQSVDSADAAAYAAQLQHLLWDTVPIAQMHYEPNIVGINKRLKNFMPRRDTMIYLWEAYLE